ncbi:MAG: 2-C-methyl-D-erythritol 2,4-cyclodiphosphate synthase [Saccharospirillum sp.]|nr:2-C-methyl-D-erythritol 2,4-cyclodiphosphate synthase [Saccharospirillum sp.]
MRIGHGFDVHRFDLQQGPTDIRLGGVAVPAAHPLLAHSDGDVVLHAICDALLGALALGDIGEWFPETDAEWADADSGLLLTRVYREIQELGWQLGNLDVTVIAQAPRLGPHKVAMRERIAALLSAESNQINVKATTTERLGFTGRKEGIATEAVCLLVQK